MIRFAAQGAAAGPVRAAMSVSQSSSSVTVRALAVGNAPITPARHAATTRSGPDTRSIGAAMTGSRSRSASRAGRAARAAVPVTRAPRPDVGVALIVAARTAAI
jgi:hypothetical protein